MQSVQSQAQLLQYYIQYYQSQGYDASQSYHYAVAYLTSYYNINTQSPYSNIITTNPQPQHNAVQQTPQQLQQQQQQKPTVQAEVKTAQKPAYIPVQQKVTYSQAVKQEEPKKQEGTSEWPETLKAYVKKVFEFYPSDAHQSVSNKLRDVINYHQKKGTIHSTDWDVCPMISLDKSLEDELIKSNLTTNGSISQQPEQPKSFNFLSENTNKNNETPVKKFTLKQKFTDLPTNLKFMSKKATKVLSSTDDDELIKEPVKKKGKFNLMEISSPGSPKTVVEPDEMAGLLPEEIERRNKRRERFESENGVRERTQLRQIMINKKAKEAFIAAGAEGNPDVIDWDEDTIVGTCQKLDKSYLRLTSAPDPSTVRPLHILKETLEMLTSKWKSDSNYTYICDQFKSLRQDLTVQRIKNDFTVKVYESHARIALEKGDLGEFNQCQAQLKQLYELNIPGNVDEFTSYRILYAIYTLNKRDINQILTKLTSHQKAQKNIKHALLVRQSVTHNDYHKFFKLYQNAPDMSVYLLDFFVERQRIIAMKFITKAYKYTISIDFLVKELGFCRLEDNKKAFVKGKKKLRKFFEENSVSCESPAKELDCQVAHEVFAEIIKKFNKVDIKGQI